MMMMNEPTRVFDERGNGPPQPVKKRGRRNKKTSVFFKCFSFRKRKQRRYGKKGGLGGISPSESAFAYGKDSADGCAVMH